MHEAKTKPNEPHASSPFNPETGPNCFTCKLVVTPNTNTTIPTPAKMQSATWILENTAGTSQSQKTGDKNAPVRHEDRKRLP
jgi:hypothetical protein